MKLTRRLNALRNYARMLMSNNHEFACTEFIFLDGTGSIYSSAARFAPHVFDLKLKLNIELEVILIQNF